MTKLVLDMRKRSPFEPFFCPGLLTCILRSIQTTTSFSLLNCKLCTIFPIWIILALTNFRDYRGPQIAHTDVHTLCVMKISGERPEVPSPFRTEGVLGPVVGWHRYHWLDGGRRSEPPPSNQLSHWTAEPLSVRGTQLIRWRRTLRVATIQSIFPLDHRPPSA